MRAVTEARYREACGFLMVVHNFSVCYVSMTICRKVEVGVMYVQSKNVSFDTLRFSDEEILELFSMQTLLGTWRFEIEGDTGLISENICRILEFSADNNDTSLDVILKNVHPDDHKMVLACFEKAIQARSSLECVYRIVRPEGHEKNVRTLGQVRVNADGAHEIFGVTYEVTQPMRAVGYVD
jgi:PAS fold